MVSGEFLDRLDEQVRELRHLYGDDKYRGVLVEDIPPLGGIQVVLVGDFLQLPPIQEKAPAGSRLLEDGRAVLPDYDDGAANPRKHELFLNRGAAYQSEVFRRLDLACVELQEPHRQVGDRAFVDLLNNIREGRCLPSELEGLNSRCSRPLGQATCVTSLLPKNDHVCQVNAERLASLGGNTETFASSDSVRVGGGGTDSQKERELWANTFWKSCLAASELELKVGAQVMLLANMDPKSGLVNGAVGDVCSFVDVPMQRVQQLVPSEQWRAVSAWCDRNVRETLVGTTNDSDATAIRLPRVNFPRARREVVIAPWLFRCDVVGAGQCRRAQLPLKLAWAITHHKAQGLTVDVASGEGVRVDPQGFQQGQTYVVLSRVTEERGLQLLKHIESGHIHVSNDALLFFAAIRAIAEAQQRLPPALLATGAGSRALIHEAARLNCDGAEELRRGIADLDALGTWRQCLRIH